jgi:glycosyltransferase involved in cell wall biosynthesis
VSIDNPYSACPYLRVTQTHGLVAAHEHIDLVWKRPEYRYGEWIPPEDLDADLVILQRTMAVALTRRTALLAKLKGIKIAYELDDDLLTLPDGHPDREKFLAMVPHFEAMLREADIVFTSTPVLASRFGAYNSQVRVIPNLLDDRLWFAQPTPKAPNRPIRIACTGTPSHRIDFVPWTDVIRNIVERYRGRVEFCFRGFTPDGLEPSPEIRIQNSLIGSYPEYARFLASAGFDFAMVPLLNNSFNAGKSNIKYLEYAACHIPGVFSETEPYSDIRGITVENTPEAWMNALCRMIEDESLRHQLGEAAFRHAYSDFRLQTHGEQLRKALEEALNFHRKD